MSEIDALMARAREFLATAQMAMRRGDYNSTANRAYHAMFHAAHALLLSKGIRPMSHGGTMSLIGQHFVNTKELDEVCGKARTRPIFSVRGETTRSMNQWRRTRRRRS